MLGCHPQGDDETVGGFAGIEAWRGGAGLTIGLAEPEVIGRQVDETGRGAPVGDLLVGEAEPVMVVVGAHRLVVVRREVDDEQPAAGTQHPCRLGDGRSGIIEVVEHVVQHGDVGRAGLDTEVIGIRLADRAMAMTQLVESAAGDVEHLLAQIDAQAVFDLIGEHLEHPARSGAHVDELLDIEIGHRRHHGGFDLVVGHVPNPHTVPVPGDRLEVGGRDLGPFGPNGRQAPQIPLERRIVGLDQSQDGVEESTTGAATGRTVEGTRALRVAFEQSGFAQQPEVAADAGLGLPEDPAQLADGQLAACQDGEDAQSSGLAGGAEGRENFIHECINISLCIDLRQGRCIDNSDPGVDAYARRMTSASNTAIPGVVDLIKGHRSIRKFTDEPVTDELVEDIIGAGLSAATSSNLQGTTVIRVRNAETRAAIAEVANGQRYIETCPAFFVWCADLHRSAIACDMGGGEFSAGMTEHFLIATVDCALAAQNAVVAAESLGLGICYIGAIRNDPQTVADLLELPDQVYPVFGLCIGWPDQDPMLKPRLPLSVTLKEDRYDDSRDRDLIAGYDDTLRSYYLERTRGARDSTWTADMSGLLGKESRPHMRDFLARRGFSMR